MGMAAPIYYTAEQIRALPDDGSRYEVVRGELLVTPAPRAWHQELIVRLTEALRAYLRRELVGHVFCSPADISWGPYTLVQPDLFVVPVADARSMLPLPRSSWSSSPGTHRAPRALSSSPSPSSSDGFERLEIVT